MAKQDALLTCRRIGNVIFYQWKVIGCARTVPRRVRQTKATKQSAKDFGRAVKLSSLPRGSLSSGLPNYNSRETMHKINAALLGWLRQEKTTKDHIPFLGLELNDKSPWSSRFKKDLLVDFEKEKVLKRLFQSLPAGSNYKLSTIDKLNQRL